RSDRLSEGSLAAARESEILLARQNDRGTGPRSATRYGPTTLVVRFTINCRVGAAGSGSSQACSSIWSRRSGNGLSDRQALQQGEQVVLGEPPVEGLRLPVRQLLVQPNPHF